MLGDIFFKVPIPSQMLKGPVVTTIQHGPLTRSQRGLTPVWKLISLVKLSQSLGEVCQKFRLAGGKVNMLRGVRFDVIETAAAAIIFPGQNWEILWLRAGVVGIGWPSPTSHRLHARHDLVSPNNEGLVAKVNFKPSSA